MRTKIYEWVRRYGPAEVVSIFGALIGAGVVHALFNNPILTALGGTWGENTGYYGVLFVQEMRSRLQEDGKISFKGIALVLRNLLIEFGPGEYLDSFIIRPVTMYIFPQLVGGVLLGTFLGKIAADVVFYIPTIISYELKKKYLN